MMMKVLEFGYCCDDTTFERIKNFLAKESEFFGRGIEVRAFKHVILH